MDWDGGLTLIASQFAGIDVDRFDRADITFERLLLVIIGDPHPLVARRKPPAEPLNLLRRVRVEQLLQLDV